jgi:acetyl esterase/lipase
MNDLSDQIRALGTEVTPHTIGATIALHLPLHEGVPEDGVQVRRDLAYGAHERHRLDVFTTSSSSQPRPVLLFVHGGGFVGGNKHTPGSPFYDNVARWANRNGLLGVNMTYRLAPEHRWPSGSDDVGRAVQWLRENAAAHGGDPERIFVMGQSAGAVHVAGYVARLSDGPGWRPTGAILVSGLYDTRSMQKNALFEAYFGAVDATSVSFLEPLARTSVPLMMVLAEYDPADFQRQAVELNAAYVSLHQRWPRFLQLTGHNHLSTVFGLNAPGDRLGPQIQAFVQSAHGGV